MVRNLRYMLILLIVIGFGSILSAQDSPESHTFGSGVSFTLPPNGTLDLSNPVIPAVTFGDTLHIQMIEPDVLTDTTLIENAPETTQDMPVLDMLELLLPAVGYPLERSDEFTLQGEFGDGREFAIYEFTNAEGLYQYVFVIWMSDGRLGAVNIQSVAPVTAGTQRTLIDMIMTFDVTDGTAGDDALPQSFTYDSGVTFRYPDNYELSAESEPVSIISDGEIIITMIEPDYAGIPVAESMSGIIDYVSNLLEMDADSFEPFDPVDGEAVISTASESDGLFESIVIVRFSDASAGIMVIVSVNELQETRLDEVARIASSFNSDNGDSANSDDVIAQAVTLNEQAGEALDNDDFDSAIELYTESIQLVSENTNAYFGRAIANRNAGNIEDAIADFQQVLEWVPDEVQIHVSLSSLYALLDDLDSAVAEMEIFIEKAGVEALSETDLATYEVYQRVRDGEYISQFYTTRSGALRSYGLYEAAISDLEFAIENEPDNALMYARLGLNYLEMGQPEVAVDTFTQGIQVEPLRVLYFNRSVAYGDLFVTDSDARVGRLNDLECILLLDDDGTLTEDQIAQVERNITTTILDGYQPITEVAQCLP